MCLQVTPPPRSPARSFREKTRLHAFAAAPPRLAHSDLHLEALMSLARVGKTGPRRAVPARTRRRVSISRRILWPPSRVR